MDNVEYDPSHLIEDAEPYYYDRPWLKKSLRGCTLVWQRTEYYIYFADPHAGHRLKGGMRLDDTLYGTITVDFYEDRRIFGIELYGKLREEVRHL